MLKILSNCLMVLSITILLSFNVVAQEDIISEYDSKGIEMVRIPSGEFFTGSTVEDAYSFCLSLYESNRCSLEQFLEFNLVSPNEYIEINGSHKYVVPNSTDKIISWSEGLR